MFGGDMRDIGGRLTEIIQTNTAWLPELGSNLCLVVYSVRTFAQPHYARFVRGVPPRIGYRARTPASVFLQSTFLYACACE